MIRNSFNKGNIEYIDTVQALDLMEQQGITVTLPTLINWVRKYNLGSQHGGRKGKWYINKKKLLQHLNGTMKRGKNA